MRSGHLCSGRVGHITISIVIAVFIYMYIYIREQTSKYMAVYKAHSFQSVDINKNHFSWGRVGQRGVEFDSAGLCYIFPPWNDLQKLIDLRKIKFSKFVTN